VRREREAAKWWQQGSEERERRGGFGASVLNFNSGGREF
jgi:hypothetical protein